MKLLNKNLTESNLNIFDLFIIVGLACVPLFSNFPYRVNIFLSWEGAYRLYLGQMPYKDFGLPMGFGYWVIPALFFKIFGPYLITLIKAQVFINILSGLSFRSILKTLKINPGVKTISVLLFCISYSFFNFWPWYNHSVIVFEIIAISFLLKFIFGDFKWPYLSLLASAFFLFWAIFTKQDGGGLALLVCGAILLYHSVQSKSYKDLLIFGGFIVGIATLAILPFSNHGFFYWFNYGQEPHYSRINSFDIITALMAGSQWEKFYLCIILIISFAKWDSVRSLFMDKRESIFLLLTLGIIAEALIFQVTSYTPPDNNIFFHSFAISFILSHVSLKINFGKPVVFFGMCALLLLWWSGTYWKYIERSVARIAHLTTQNNDPSKISRNTYIINRDTTNISMAEWTFSDLPVFNRIYMPGPTVDGIKRLMDMPQVKGIKSPKVLNMTELTPLAYGIPYEIEKGQPLWYHKGVGIFQKEVDAFCQKIINKQYDIVLFETVPYLNNFYPEEVRRCLQKNYVLKDKFLAPRRPTDSYIEVFTAN